LSLSISDNNSLLGDNLQVGGTFIPSVACLPDGRADTGRRQLAPAAKPLYVTSLA